MTFLLEKHIIHDTKHIAKKVHFLYYNKGSEFYGFILAPETPHLPALTGEEFSELNASHIYLGGVSVLVSFGQTCVC